MAVLHAGAAVDRFHIDRNVETRGTEVLLIEDNVAFHPLENTAWVLACELQGVAFGNGLGDGVDRGERR